MTWYSEFSPTWISTKIEWPPTTVQDFELKRNRKSFTRASYKHLTTNISQSYRVEVHLDLHIRRADKGVIQVLHACFVQSRAILNLAQFRVISEIIGLFLKTLGYFWTFWVIFENFGLFLILILVKSLDPALSAGWAENRITCELSTSANNSLIKAAISR